MPPQVQVSYCANYTDTEVGILTQTGVNVFDAITRGDQQSIGDEFKKGAVDFGISGLLKAADVAAPGARAACLAGAITFGEGSTRGCVYATLHGATALEP